MNKLMWEVLMMSIWR